MFSAEIVDRLGGNNSSIDRDLPVQLCVYFNEDDDVYGDRICNNALAGSIISILVAMVLFLVDVQVPCVSTSTSVCAAIKDIYSYICYMYIHVYCI